MVDLEKYDRVIIQGERNRILSIINSKDWHEIFSTEEIVNWKNEESTRAIRKAMKREFGFE